MYLTILSIHSWLRYLVVIFIILVFAISLKNFFQKKPFTRLQNTLSIALVGSTHVQFLLGLILYFWLSPSVQIGLGGFPASMKHPSLRYWTVEHFITMTVFVFVIQVGRLLARKESNIHSKHKKLSIFSGLGIIILVIGVPWPWTMEKRPLFRCSQCVGFLDKNEFYEPLSYDRTPNVRASLIQKMS